MAEKDTAAAALSRLWPRIGRRARFGTYGRAKKKKCDSVVRNVTSAATERLTAEYVIVIDWSQGIMAVN